MEKNLIITTVMGHGKGSGFGEKIWNICIPVMKLYADKIGADFKVFDGDWQGIGKKYEGTSPFMYKLGMWSFLDTYERVLCLDADMLITTLAPNVFETFPEKDVFYGMDASYTDRAHIVKPYIEKYKIDWPIGSYGNPRQYNGGFWLVGNELNLEHDCSDFIGCKGYEENFVNYMLIKNGCKTYDVGIKWDKICCDKTTDRRECYIIHHGGWGFADNWKDLRSEPLKLWESKWQCCVDDYEYFYGKK